MTLITRMALPILITLTVGTLGGCENHSSQELVLPVDTAATVEPTNETKNLRGDLTNPEGSEFAIDTGERHEGDPQERFTLDENEVARRQTHRNAYIMERAMWSYIGDNGGEIPYDFQRENLAGKALVDYFPGGEPLLNSYTRHRTEPQYGSRPSTPGQVGFWVIYDARNIRVGFVIFAFDQYHESLEYSRYLPGYEPPLEPQGSTSTSR